MLQARVGELSLGSGQGGRGSPPRMLSGLEAKWWWCLVMLPQQQSARAMRCVGGSDKWEEDPKPALFLPPKELRKKMSIRRKEGGSTYIYGRNTRRRHWRLLPPSCFLLCSAL
jgi:hypothetical protein